jgi:hypothetical protein
MSPTETIKEAVKVAKLLTGPSRYAVASLCPFEVIPAGSVQCKVYSAY